VPRGGIGAVRATARGQHERQNDERTHGGKLWSR